MLGIFNRLIDSNEREVKRLGRFVEEINALEPELQGLSDEDVRARMAALRAEIAEEAAPEEPAEDELEGEEQERRWELARERRKRDLAVLKEALDERLPEVFAATREMSRRRLGMRHFDVQLMGGVVLHEGRIAEMKTGEGKTLVAPLAAVLNGLSGRGVHVITVNDYLAKRDAQWMGPVFHGLGLSVGVIQHDSAYVFDPDYRATDEHLLSLRPVVRQEAYAADVTYGTNNEFGFDYLRDNMVLELPQRVQRERYFGIVDEVDNILIDEARTPLIISGEAEESADKYYLFARLMPRLSERPEGAEEGGDYFVDLKEKQVSPTEDGITRIERLVGVENLYDSDPTLARHFVQALNAHALYKRDRDYIVKDGEIVIVDEFTGRQMPGRRWSEGLHQAIEAKEGLRVKRESVTLATITFQNYFRLYDKLAGMTGTAMTEHEEFYKIYGLEVVAIPTHRPMVREDVADLVFRTESAKWNALTDEIEEMRDAGRPVLVGTTSVEKSERLSELLNRRGVSHQVLNAKLHEKEASIVAQAGRTGAVTIATNMAGRGVDILLGGNPAGLASDILHRKGLNPAEVEADTYAAALEEAKGVTAEDHDKVVEAGGLHIIGTERHDARRIDNQLRGRAGRQGDPGSSRFYLSLDDDLMKRFASDRVAGLMERFGLEEEVPIESGLVSKTIESAQSRVEGFNFDMRKRVVELDDVINKQRETIYRERDKILRNEDLTETVRAFLEEEVDSLLDMHTGADDLGAWTLDELSRGLVGMGLPADEVAEGRLAEPRTPEAMRNELEGVIDRAIEAREADVGEADWATIERLVLLRTVDALWVEHLTELDDLRRGIHLRGYAQTDPINAFKVEAYRLYQELQGLIRHQVATTILRVTVVRQPQEAPRPMPMVHPIGAGGDGRTAVGAGAAGGAAGGAAIATAAAGVGSAAATPLAASPMAGAGARASRIPAGIAGAAGPGAATGPDGRKLGRNDPCWCGSGKKFKRCHGA